MEVDLKEKSWHTSLYKWTYQKRKFDDNKWWSRSYDNQIPREDCYYYDSKLPNNLCPYFWKVVLAIVMSPFLVMSVPNSKIFRVKTHDLTDKVWASLFFLLYSSGSFIFIISLYLYPFKTSLITASVVLGIAFIVGCALLINWLSETNWSTKYKYKEKSDNQTMILLKSFIKAKKNKVCPKINWK